MELKVGGAESGHMTCVVGSAACMYMYVTTCILKMLFKMGVAWLVM